MKPAITLDEPKGLVMLFRTPILIAPLLLITITHVCAQDSSENSGSRFIDPWSVDSPQSSQQLTSENARELFKSDKSKQPKNPGDPGLNQEVYECALKNLAGVGSDMAARMIWASCLALSKQ